MNKIETFLDQFEDKLEGKDSLSEQERNELAALVGGAESLGDGLPLILKKDTDFTEAAKSADGQVKAWQQTKKMWQTRHDELMRVLQVALASLPGKSIKADNIKLSTSSRTCLEVDEEWILQQYQKLADVFQQTLPPFVAVKLSLDKNKLSSYLNTDNSLLLNHPDKIHTRNSSSTTIKVTKR